MIVDFHDTNPIHILPYLVFLAIYVSLALSSEVTRNKLFHWAGVGVALLFAGFQNTISPDMVRYREFYEHYRDSDFLRLLEPSFVVISAALHTLGLDYHALFFLYTSLTILFVYGAIRNLTPYIKTSMLVYILVPHLYLTLFIEMRQECAVAMVFYAMSLIPREELRFRRLRVVAFAALSVVFHYSAAGYWLVYLIGSRLFRRDYPVKLYLALLVITLVTPSWLVLNLLWAAVYPILPPAYQLHVESLKSLGEAAGAHSVVSLLIFNIMALAFVLARQSIKSAGRPLGMFLNLFFAGVLVLNLTRDYGDIARFANYFIIYEIILVPALLYKTGLAYSRPAVAYAVMLLYCIHFVHGLYYLNAETDSYIYLHYSNALVSVFTNAP